MKRTTNGPLGLISTDYDYTQIKQLHKQFCKQPVHLLPQFLLLVFFKRWQIFPTKIQQFIFSWNNLGKLLLNTPLSWTISEVDQHDKGMGRKQFYFLYWTVTVNEYHHFLLPALKPARTHTHTQPNTTHKRYTDKLLVKSAKINKATFDCFLVHQKYKYIRRLRQTCEVL